MAAEGLSASELGSLPSSAASGSVRPSPTPDRQVSLLIEATPHRASSLRSEAITSGSGTGGSNLVSSSSESATKLASCITAVPRNGELIRVSSSSENDVGSLDNNASTLSAGSPSSLPRRSSAAVG